ncbi:MAG: hypothetical protein KAX20_07745, partial [Candidatus Omnitrophica bacterium]|nr:hypothetical protein [Candidatus Omnitrophota bacterium]
MNWYGISSFSALILDLFLGYFVYSKDKTNLANIGFGLGSLTLGIWIFGDSIRSLAFLTDTTVLPLARISHAGASFFPACWLLFALALVDVHKRRALIAAYLVSTLLAISTLTTSLFIKGVSLTAISESNRWIIEEGSLYYVFVSYFVWAMIYGYYALV